MPACAPRKRDRAPTARWCAPRARRPLPARGRGPAPQELDAGGGDELAADLAARKRAPSPPPRPSGRRARAAAPRSRPPGPPPITSRVNASRARTKRWLKSPPRAPRASSRRRGQTADSSLPANPARTLTTASWRVTSLQPSSQAAARRSAMRERRGSQATKSGARSRRERAAVAQQVAVEVMQEEVRDDRVERLARAARRILRARPRPRGSCRR